MNFLFLECYSGKNIRSQVIKHILEAIPCQNAYIVDSVIPPLPLNSETSINFYDFNNIIDGSYIDVEWSKIPPIDPELRNDFFEIESEFCGLSERLSYSDNTVFRKEKYFEYYKKTLVNPFFKGNLEYSERLDIYLKHLRFWNHFLSNNEIDTIIYLDNAPHLGYDLIIYELAKKKKIRCVFDALGVLPSYKVFVNDYKLLNNNLSNWSIIQEKISEFKSKDFIDEWNRLNSETQQQLPRKSEIIIRNQDKIIKKKYWRNKLKKIKISKNYLNIHFWQFQFKLKDYRYFNNVLLNFYDVNCSTPKFSIDKYIYVPLHYQPEMTTAPMGGMYANQLLMIQQLAYYLPKDCFLYIKEHPRQTFKNRTIHFYGEILKISNAKLISKEINSFELMDNALAVATVTGTAGWEGLFKNKPFLMFGYHVYQFAPGVLPIRTNTDCKDAINKVMGGEIKINKQDLKKFMLAYENISVKYDQENNLEEFTKTLISNIMQY